MSKLILSGGVARWDISARYVKQELSKMSGDIEVEISSFGGDFYEGMEIFNLLKSYSKTKGKVTTIVTSKAMSSGSHIFLAGDVRKAHSNATIMCHNSWSFAMGDSHDMSRQAKILDGIDGIQASIYSRFQDKELSAIKAEMRSEMWYIGSEQLLASGFVDEIIDSDEAPVSLGSMKAEFGTFKSKFRSDFIEHDDEVDFDEVEASISTCKSGCTLGTNPSTSEQIEIKTEGVNMTLEEVQAQLTTANATISTHKADMDGKDAEIKALNDTVATHETTISTMQTDHKDALVVASETAQTEIKAEFKEIMAMSIEADAPKDVAVAMAECSTKDEAQKVMANAMVSAGVTFNSTSTENNDPQADNHGWGNTIKKRGE